jgi:integrase
MKMGLPHDVPLSDQVIALVESLKEIGNRGRFLFPSSQSFLRPICENTLNYALRRMGYTNDQMTSHGFRALASTRLNEAKMWHPDAVERALAHRETNKVRAAYDRAMHWDERTRMMQWWSDYLDRLRDGSNINPAVVDHTQHSTLAPVSSGPVTTLAHFLMQ